MRCLLFCLGTCAATTLAACGNSRVAPPGVAAPQPPRGTHLASWPLRIVGVETVAGQRRMVRSTHIFRERSEVVVEALAPPAAFGGLARTVFDPLLRSLVIRPLRR